MQLQDLVRSLRRNLLLAIPLLLLGSLAGMLQFRQTPVSYASGVEFYIATPTNTGSPSQASQFATDRLSTYVDLMSSDEVARRVIQKTGVNEAVDVVRAKISAKARANTVIIGATVVDSTQEDSLKLAKGLASGFAEAVDALDNAGTVKPVEVRVVSGPEPLGRASSGLLKYLAIGIAGALVLWVFQTLIRHALDPRVDTTADIEALTGSTIVGHVRRGPTLPVSHRGDRSGDHILEPFRQLRTVLEAQDAGADTDVVLVVSATDNEGAAQVALGLAAAEAELGRPTVVVEANLRTDRLSERDSGTSGPGLAQILAGDVEPDQATHQLSEGLWILPGGGTMSQPGEMLARQGMSEVVAHCRRSYGRVFLLGPALDPVADSGIISRYADYAVLVVGEGKPSPTAVESTVAQLAATGCPIKGIVVTSRRGWFSPSRTPRRPGSKSDSQLTKD